MQRGRSGVRRLMLWTLLVFLVPMVPGCGGCGAAPEIKPRNMPPEEKFDAKAPAKGTRTPAQTKAP